MEENTGFEDKGNIEIQEKNSFKNKVKENPWILTTIALGIIVLILLYLNFSGVTGGVISEGDASNKVVEYLNSRVGGGIEYISAEDMGSLYQVLVSYEGQDIPVFITKDGEYFIQAPIPITMTGEASQGQENQEQDIPKSDKPKVELFVMTHCPYGTQSEKGIIPVFELLGNKIDSEIRFVHYFMHEPEETETPRQVCIREEQEDKYLDYLSCFLEDGDYERCLTETGIDETKLNSCIENNAEGYYSSDSEISEGYGVQGSPTLVVNGQIVSSSRSPQAYLDTICSAFTSENVLEECSQQLLTSTPSAGFGYTEGTDTQAQC